MVSEDKKNQIVKKIEDELDSIRCNDEAIHVWNEGTTLKIDYDRVRTNRYYENAHRLDFFLLAMLSDETIRSIAVEIIESFRKE